MKDETRKRNPHHQDEGNLVLFIPHPSAFIPFFFILPCPFLEQVMRSLHIGAL